MLAGDTNHKNWWGCYTSHTRGKFALTHMYSRLWDLPHTRTQWCAPSPFWGVFVCVLMCVFKWSIYKWWVMGDRYGGVNDEQVTKWRRRAWCGAEVILSEGHGRRHWGDRLARVTTDFTSRSVKRFSKVLFFVRALVIFLCYFISLWYRFSLVQKFMMKTYATSFQKS